MYWFLKECVANVQCRWGPCAIGQQRNNHRAIKGEDPYTASIHGTDIGMAVATMKHYRGNWKRTSDNSDNKTKSALFVDEDGDVSNDEDEEDNDEEDDDNNNGDNDRDQDAQVVKSRKKIKTRLYQQCWDRHSQRAINSIHGIKKQDNTRVILVDDQDQRVTPQALKDRFKRIDEFMRDRLLEEMEAKMGKNKKKRRRLADEEAVASVTKKSKLTCVTDNENLFNGSRWCWDDSDITQNAAAL